VFGWLGGVYFVVGVVIIILTLVPVFLFCNQAARLL